MATFRCSKQPSIVIIESSHPFGWSSYEDTSSLGSCIVNPFLLFSTPGHGRSKKAQAM
jgi:flagellar assembly factor FliW